MGVGPGDFADRAAVEAAFSAHVDPAKVDIWAMGGLEVVMGERGGAAFTDAYDGRRWFNCHCNGGARRRRGPHGPRPEHDERNEGDC